MLSLLRLELRTAVFTMQILCWSTLGQWVGGGGVHSGAIWDQVLIAGTMYLLVHRSRGRLR
jgi:hypothetical protein